MQFERITLQEFTPGLVIAPEAKRIKTFIPQFNPHKEVAVAEAPAEPPPPPTFSEAELQAAKEEGYRQGFMEGEKKGLAHAESEMAIVNKQIRDLMGPLAEKLLGLFTYYNQFILQQKQTTPLLAGAMAKKIAGEALTDNALVNIEQTCIQCIERMLGEAEIHIYVHTTLADQLEEKLIKHFARSHEPGNVLIHKDESLTGGACRIEWKHGGLDYNPATIMAQMDQLVQGIAGAQTHTHSDITPEIITEAIALATPAISPNPEMQMPSLDIAVPTTVEPSNHTPGSDAARPPIDNPKE